MFFIFDIGFLIFVSGKQARRLSPVFAWRFILFAVYDDKIPTEVT